MTFNDHEGSTKSYGYMKEHEEPLHELDFVPCLRGHRGGDPRRRSAWMSRCTTGSLLRIRKLDRDYDPTKKLAALAQCSRKPRRRAKCLPACCT